jgi:hypothetical protein
MTLRRPMNVTQVSKGCAARQIRSDIGNAGDPDSRRLLFRDVRKITCRAEAVP